MKPTITASTKIKLLNKKSTKSISMLRNQTLCRSFLWTFPKPHENSIIQSISGIKAAKPVKRIKPISDIEEIIENSTEK